LWIYWHVLTPAFRASLPKFHCHSPPRAIAIVWVTVSIPMESWMRALADFPSTHRWPAEHLDRLQLYSLPTPNGVKVSIMLEEIRLP